MNKQISKIKSIIEKAGLIKGSRKTGINKIDAGVTNQVFSVFEDQAPKFIVRMYGNNLDALIDREYENKLLLYFNLSLNGFLLCKTVHTFKLSY